MTEAALVLLSGGQDSTVCLAWALDRFEAVETIGFDYGQRHRVELQCRVEVREAFEAFPQWNGRLRADHMLDLSALKDVTDTALTREMEIQFTSTGLPNTFVPGRNLLFFTYAAAVAYRRDIRHLVGGMCETDYSGYPDCRDDTLKILQVALNLGMEKRFVMHTPLMWIDKAETWRLAAQLGGPDLVQMIIDKTHTCYNSNRDSRHGWGYGCGYCPACELRASGFARYEAKAS